MWRITGHVSFSIEEFWKTCANMLTQLSMYCVLKQWWEYSAAHEPLRRTQILKNYHFFAECMHCAGYSMSIHKQKYLGLLLPLMQMRCDAWTALYHKSTSANIFLSNKKWCGSGTFVSKARCTESFLVFENHFYKKRTHLQMAYELKVWGKKRNYSKLMMV